MPPCRKTNKMSVVKGLGSANWRKRPSNKILRNYSAMVLKPLCMKYRHRGVRPRAGDAINSPDNNMLTMLYAGKDSYHLIDKMLNAVPAYAPGDPNEPKVKETVKQTLERLQRDGLQTKFGLISICFYLGGDLAFLTEFFGLAGCASNYPSVWCEIMKHQLSFLWCQFTTETKPRRRSNLRINMCAHAYGAKWGITEPYRCPGCKVPPLPARTRPVPLAP